MEGTLLTRLTYLRPDNASRCLLPSDAEDVVEREGHVYRPAAALQGHRKSG